MITSVTSPYSQSGFRVGFDWGPVGAAAVPGSLVAVVDVLSFTTAVTVAVDNDIDVLPYRWRDETAVAFAEEHDAVLAVGRSQPGITLSPVTIQQAQGVRRLVLPWVHDLSAVERQRLDRAGGLIAKSGRRSRMGRLQTRRRPSTQCGGDRRGGAKDRSLRPAVEDLWGAGGFIAALADREVGPLSPEARAAVAAYREVEKELPQLLHECAGGRELTRYGFAEDAAIAAELDSSRVVPVLTDGAFKAAAVDRSWCQSPGQRH
jgi:2-phosphosulfolactate phosphatase